MNEELNLETINSKAEKLKESLRQTIWPPVTYMLIPSVLKQADQYIEFLKAFDDEKSKTLLKELEVLRLNFKREK